MDILILFLILGGKHPVSIIEYVSCVSVIFFFCVCVVGLYQVEKITYIFNLLSVFVIKGYWILSNAFYASTDMIIWFLSFILMWCITVMDFYMLSQPCTQG